VLTALALKVDRRVGLGELERLLRFGHQRAEVVSSAARRSNVADAAVRLGESS
jgi:hypothetical protein